MKSLPLGFGAALSILSSLVSVSSQSSVDASVDACGKAANAIANVATSVKSIPARTAYDCLADIPLHKDEALHTVEQLRLYLQFYSAQAYFAHPPTPELELNPVDMNKTLDTTESNIKSGKYPNEYSFYRDLFNLFGDYRDGHVAYYPQCYTAFIFRHQYSLISVAKSPDCIPDIHVTYFVGDQPQIRDKVVKINGQSAVDYLTQMANNHPELAWVDPDARFNELLVQSVGGKFRRGLFAARLTYEADENLILTWENGTTTEIVWLAELLPTISPNLLNSSETFYQNVCIRSPGEIANATGTPTPGDEPPEIEKRWNNLMKRTTNDTRPVLALDDGTLALHILDHETAVLEITAFHFAVDDPEDTYLSRFSSLVTDAISYMKKNGITKIIIDLSGNGGGFLALGENLAKQLFPTVDHYFASNIRWNPAIDTMLTKGADPDGTYLDLGHLRKLDGSDFTSYKEWLGPVFKDGDYFSQISRPDFAEQSDEADGLPVSYPGPQPFDTHNIVVISSGMCGSTCAVFAEALMEQGVHSVSFGGRPRVGPMQLVGGIKGSQVLTFDDIAALAYGFLGENVFNYSYIPEAHKVATVGASINFRNSWRKDNQTTPIEFLYTPSEYKLSYTSEMITNQTLLWSAAKDVVWNGAKDLSGDGYQYSVHASVVNNEGNVVNGSAYDSIGEGISWSSLGELIWLKIDGHAMDLNL